MLKLLKSAAGNWRVWLALTVLVVGAFATVAGQSYLRGKDIKTLTAEKATLEAELKSVGKLLADQNNAVKALEQASIDQASRAQQAAKAAERALGASNARADALALIQVPAACPDALEWLRAEVSKSATAQESTQ